MDAGDADEEQTNCNDACKLGETECNHLLGPCSSDDAAICALPQLGVSTCILGTKGCTVWSAPASCTSSVACCVPCTSVPCGDGSPYMCPSCPLGNDGAACAQDSDCGLNSCDSVSHTCVRNQCADHRQDGDESDVDCGGMDCLPCAKGLRCKYNSDCQASDCSATHVCTW
jgi:hypothetical protein